MSLINYVINLLNH